jgi:hypothetical protein
MDIEKLIRETLTVHENDAADADTVLAATRQRLDRRRSVLTRPLAVAAGVVVLTLAAVTVVALNRPDPAPTDAAPVAGPVHKTPAAPSIADLRMPFSLGWLPPGSVDYVARRINIGGSAENPTVPVYGGEYMLTVKGKGPALDVDVQEFRMASVDEAAFKSGPGSPVTIDGRRGVESSHSDGPGGYELYLTHPEVGSMYVNVSGAYGASVPAQQLIDTGRRIAKNLRFPGTSTVTPAFGLGDLPAGMRVCTFDVEGAGPAGDPKGPKQPSTTYELGKCDTLPPIVVGTPSVNKPAGTPGKPVRGHETRYVDDSGYRTLWVLNAVHDDAVSIAGRVSLDELYDIANRLVLPR